MGAKHVIMFEDKDFLNSINIAKWHIYAASLIDCTFFCFSYLYKERNFSKTEEANRIFFEILNTEKLMEWIQKHMKVQQKNLIQDIRK